MIGAPYGLWLTCSVVCQPEKVDAIFGDVSANAHLFVGGGISRTRACRRMVRTYYQAGRFESARTRRKCTFLRNMRAFVTGSVKHTARTSQESVVGRLRGGMYFKWSEALLDAVVVDAEHDEVVPADLLNVIFVCHCQRAAGQHTLVDRSRRVS